MSDPMASDQNQPKDKKGPKPSGAVKMNLERLIFIAKIVIKEVESDDFRASIVYTVEDNGGGGGSGSYGGKGGFRSSHNKFASHLPISLQDNPTLESYQFDISCMNPAVVFKDIRESARSVILCSGTLSPTSSFACELNSEFTSAICPHVIEDPQLLARCLAYDQDGDDLMINANYLKSEQNLIKLFNIIKDICSRTPNGVLVFFSSYASLKKFKFLIEKFSHRLGKQIKKQKFWESEATSKDLDKFMKKYYLAAENPGNGAVLFGVFRGKLSEGFDFEGSKARAVITIGIPYPYRSGEVIMKCDYNDAKRKLNKDFLCGNEWYQIEALRALNQAIGRVIRNRTDWGGIFLIDQRFRRAVPYQEGLSKWVRKRLEVSENYEYFLGEVERFMKIRVMNPIKLSTDPKVDVVKKEVKTQTSDTSSTSKPISGFELLEKFKIVRPGVSKACKKENAQSCQIPIKNENEVVFTKKEKPAPAPLQPHQQTKSFNLNQRLAMIREKKRQEKLIEQQKIEDHNLLNGKTLSHEEIVCLTRNNTRSEQNSQVISLISSDEEEIFCKKKKGSEVKDVKDDAKDDEVVSNFSESLLPSDIDDLSRPVTPKINVKDQDKKSVKSAPKVISLDDTINDSEFDDLSFITNDGENKENEIHENENLEKDHKNLPKVLQNTKISENQTIG